ncbi:probable E3 ubiquitin-protein ligase HERC4, partial [Strongylocentrotus purpuratus]|uniref:HECT domain-containing protein n=1 Tax=Strongylocentrotus purpuratus TaxID=7668 RepID=A0A7M7NLL1_STRPU
RHHSLALSADGRVYSWGRNDVGQLGIRKKKQRYDNQSQITQDFTPRLIEELSNYDVIQIACGDVHSIALTLDGRLFSWGCNRHGQLGVETKWAAKEAKDHAEKPIEIEGLWGIPVQHIAAGGAHSVALSTTGSIFVWGSNTHGQLGLQKLDDVKLPVKLCSLSQGNVKVVSCGMHHTSFLKQNGQLMVYGMGVDGYPCESDEWGKSELRPGRPGHTFSFLQSTNRCTYAVDEITNGVFVLDHEKVQKGGNVQLEPLEEGSMVDLFEPESSTDWPPGRYGFDPKVWEPSRPVEDYEHVERFEEGTRRYDVEDDEDGITDLSATLDTTSVTNEHDGHAGETLEYVPGITCVGQENHQRQPRTWRRLCAGQENIFIIEQDEPVRKDVHISIAPGREIGTLSAGLLQSLSDINIQGDITEEDALFQYASMVFSSPACLNASFRQTGPNEVDGLNVDLKAARRAYKVISKNDKLLEKLSEVISVNLCTSIPQSTPHIEALRFIYILMECPVFSNHHRPWGRRALAAADRLIGFLHMASKAGEKKSNSATPARWWKFEPMSFRRTIMAYRRSLTILFHDRVLLEKELANFWTYLRILGSLNEINLQHDILSIKTFYIPNLDKVWIRPHQPLQKFSWASYPFLIDLEMKTKMLESYNISEQDNAMEQAMRQHPMFGFCYLLGIPVPRLCLLLNVSRDDIFGWSVRKQLAEMLTLPRSWLQIPLMVQFMGEIGLDEGALSMDFFRLVFEELFDPGKNGLFRYVDELDPTHSPVWFRKDCEDSKLAEICGLLCGFSLHNKAIVPLPFPQLLYAKLLGKGPNSDMEEAAELDKEFADQMSKLRTGTEDYVMGCCYGEKVELKNGRSVDVTKENVHLYVDNMVRDYLVPSQFAAFQRGFNRVFNPAAFDMFRPIELEALVMGEKHFDWKALEQSTQYIQPYTDSHPTIKIFWTVFHALDNDMKRKFLVFVAGSDRVPVGGLRNLGLHIDHLQVPMDDSVDEQPCDTEDRLTRMLPVGHGCDNHGYRRTLRLPMYTSLELMEDRLTVALSYYDCPFHIA